MGGMCIERRKQERREETETRRRTWQERFAERSDSRAAAAAAGAPEVEDTGRKRSGPFCDARSHFSCILCDCGK